MKKIIRLKESDLTNMVRRIIKEKEEKLDLDIDDIDDNFDMENNEKETIEIDDEKMDMLHEKGICTCDDKCLIYPSCENIDPDELLDALRENDGDCVIISEDQMEMLHDEGSCDCGSFSLVLS